MYVYFGLDFKYLSDKKACTASSLVTTCVHGRNDSLCLLVWYGIIYTLPRYHARYMYK